MTAVAKPVSQGSDPPQILTMDTGSCLDLKRENRAVITLKDKVDLVCCGGAKVPDRDRRIPPADLLEDLTHVPVLGQHSGITWAIFAGVRLSSQAMIPASTR
ncbi:hypothetical protein [Actinocrispum wychmicini]|uniref:Uncharacterized protein n=1 Tax=Actinocrispum wychmicini TaxID=1213861 RepID=A0A4R2J6H2_9PSEU|nr:hypothetical protein [Actinocrispum wychmicini]TCO53132.1 hypothetical protein EV192_111329 [Actinocrispum wychmicini]